MKWVPACLAGALCALACAGATAEATAGEEDYGLETISLGVLAHDVGAFGTRKEEGVDFNLELRFDPLSGVLWDFLLNPRPHVGLSVNSAGDTSQAYAGLSWLFEFGDGLFGGGSLGGAVHNGETETAARDRKSLGSAVLFRESIELGVRFAERHSLSLMLDHISNAGLAEHNEGMDNVGLRYALRL